MVSVKDLRTRIKGIQGTKKITKAMKTMSLIRLQKAEERAINSKPYIYAITDIVSHVQANNVYFRGNKSDTTLFVIFTSDRGLCGAFNENLLKNADAMIAKKNESGRSKLILIGTKASMHYARKKCDIYSSYTHLPPNPTISISNLVMNDCKKLFLNGEVGEVIIIYNNLKKKLVYDIKIKKMLPVSSMIKSGVKGINPLYIFEPNKKDVINNIMEMYLEATVFHSFLDLYGSEYSARFIAMNKATENAEDMISSLMREMNKTRQAQITKDILEVINGAEAVRG